MTHFDPVAVPSPVDRPRWTTLTVAAIGLAAAGVLFSVFAGLGMLPAIAAVVTGFISHVKTPENRPWGLVAGLSGVFGMMVAAIVLITIGVMYLT